MKFTEQLECFESIIALMKLRATGTSYQLAEKLQISERTLYDYLKAPMERGADFITPKLISLII
nr:helix-turn-helix domain-containing protein [uncultured Carboxylicivirga sp.]